jgi:hypothetical protein
LASEAAAVVFFPATDDDLGASMSSSKNAVIFKKTK